jgi:maltose alpha-D-glucosyltransferase/alpha-amylase
MTFGIDPTTGDVFHLQDHFGPGPIGTVLPDLVARSFPILLPNQRWFGQKQRRISSVELFDHLVVQHRGELFALCLVRVHFDAGDSSDYFVPLAFTARRSEEVAVIATVSAANGQWFAVDATRSPTFRTWLADELATEQVRLSPHGRLSWSRTIIPFEPQFVSPAKESRVVSTEQSNTSIVYGDTLIVKLFRRIETGLNPDVELGRFLTERTTFRNVPALIGDLRYANRVGSVASLAVAQRFVVSVGDGWNVTLSALEDAVLQAPFDKSQLLEDARMLGARTAQMHIALASDHDDPLLCPELIDETEIQIWSNNLTDSLTRVEDALSAASASMDSSTRHLALSFQRKMPSFRTRVDRLALLRGLRKTRVHGDYHLGQTLVTPNRDFVVLDFEGEPRRSIAERRRKTTPLKDVAGMLRSFGYARGATERRIAASSRALSADLPGWERSARTAFLNAYFDEARSVDCQFVPTTRETFLAACVPWELDKALYEVEYELNTRLDWLDIPLAATLALA